MNTSLTQSLEALFSRLEAFVLESRACLAVDDVPDLDDLDNHVNTLCEFILRLSQHERLVHADRLQRLLADIQLLGENMIKKRDLIGVEISDISKRKKANIAYTATEVSGVDDDNTER
jgi:hypothetical protein